MKDSSQERLFLLAMWWRIIYGSFRIFLGLAVLQVVGKPLLDVVMLLMRREIVEDPSDIFYSFVVRSLTDHPMYITYFLAVYFIFWGVVDIFLSYNLLKHRMWAFSLSLTLIGLFIMYELWRFQHTQSFVLLGLIFLDTAIFWLVWREYKKLERRKAQRAGLEAQ